MKYRCILIDHDDTAVNSTPSVHHPAHVEQMKRLGREEQTRNLEDWFRLNYHPGIHHFLEKELALNEKDALLCYNVWREYTQSRVPPFFPGMLDLLSEVVRQGGVVAVVSHSEVDIIRRHYELQQDVPGFMPAEIFGWTGDPTKAKPHVYPVEEMIRRHALKPEEIIMIDDLKPGIEMSRRAGIASMGAGWSHAIPEIRKDISEMADYYFTSVEDAARWLLD
ncbi:HAD family hydrolase [Salinispira pacifica]|uniref:phosphoglycolate phosphatase n=1 Tax=Salinispira pacifica TaxID=1307761 RepID=V5WFR3_9SPIO|nr:HAD hydrolase-like protein [Salinispira pacifica]AHC14404.1 hypothetical protein L21SP2_0986 [Salinispira pacifica]